MRTRIYFSKNNFTGKSSNKSAVINIEYKNGNPVALNNKKLSPAVTFKIKFNLWEKWYWKSRFS